jgi:glycosyl hydrolase family 2
MTYPRKTAVKGWIILVVVSLLYSVCMGQEAIPLPEHPRPDFQRPAWQNLNGTWSFGFDKDNVGIKENWFQNPAVFTQKITVPFPWGSKLSGIKDEGDIGWYRREIRIPHEWQGQRVFLVIGACDWHTTAWLDNQKLGDHQGGYTPFEFELTPHLKISQEQVLVLRVDDAKRPFKLEGKQGYGPARGIWQTPYLEARGSIAIRSIHFSPDIDQEKASVEVELMEPAPEMLLVKLRFKNQPPDLKPKERSVMVKAGDQLVRFDVSIPNTRLWSLEDPFLYEVTAHLAYAASNELRLGDEVATYFGMRKISVGILPGTDFPYVTLNDKPIYLQLALDQAYHPEGFYTFPSDAFMRDEILRTRRIGLNGQRIHIKVEVPRKLYWADRLGVLIMADVPNSWGPPDEKMQSEIEYALRGMVKRDYNHPAIFSWVNFNETWGLRTGKKGYTGETQQWVERMYLLTKQLDPTRLVEDNSPCNNDHVITDLNTWHAYLPGYAWRERLDQICRDTHPGSTWNYIGGRKQKNEPMLNSECGNVWGYEGSAGDVDWSWDYHIMINEFRRHPKVCGWLYTEHHDVINEWNGYWRYDRSEKYTGMEDLVPDMSMRDLHSDFYIASEPELCRKVKPGETIAVPLFASFFTDKNVGSKLTLDLELYGWDSLGVRKTYWQDKQEIPGKAWLQQELPPARITMPKEPSLAILSMILKDATGCILHRNFTAYLVADGPSPRQESVPTANNRKAHLIRFKPDTFRDAKWSLKQWNVLDGLKVNGAGAGYFEYEIPWPKNLKLENIEQATIRMELSAKQLFGKDRKGAGKQEGDFMRGKGTHDPSLNRNAYPMTDDEKFPSAVRIRVMGQSAGVFDLPDDSADHRGILSWYSQKRDRYLREAGSYGVLVEATIPTAALRKAYQQKRLLVRLEVDDALPHGVAIYGERFGRYPIDPTLVFLLAE